MPVNDGSDYSQVAFRKSVESAGGRRLGFWHVFAAVLLALFVHSVVVGLFVEWRVRVYVADVSSQLAEVSGQLDAEIAKLEAEFPVEDFVRPARPAARPQPAAQALPGTIRARETGADRACVNGRIYRRLPNGWDHIGGRCRATSQ